MKLASDTPAGLITSTVAKVLDHVLPEDPAAREAAALKVLELQNAGTFDQRASLQLASGQLEVNKAEAVNGSAFAAGWRPFIGWICGSAMAFQYIVRPLWVAVATPSGHPAPVLPGLDENLWQLLTGMLGLGALRTVEKVKAAS
ncbi:MAG TPA: holin family protein [Roseateles sp.]|nr:holin family protein [Roseateles sp.]